MFLCFQLPTGSRTILIITYRPCVCGVCVFLPFIVDIKFVGRTTSRGQFGEGGGQLDRRRGRGGLNPCARESSGLNREVSEGKADV